MFLSFCIFIVKSYMKFRRTKCINVSVQFMTKYAFLVKILPLKQIFFFFLIVDNTLFIFWRNIFLLAFYSRAGPYLLSFHIPYSSHLLRLAHKGSQPVTKANAGSLQSINTAPHRATETGHPVINLATESRASLISTLAEKRANRIGQVSL